MPIRLRFKVGKLGVAVGAAVATPVATSSVACWTSGTFVASDGPVTTAPQVGPARVDCAFTEFGELCACAALHAESPMIIKNAAMTLHTRFPTGIFTPPQIFKQLVILR